jgi:hypothetical protein
MATYHNVCTLSEAGFKRITVLIRDPRDSTVSWTYHLRAPAMGERMRNFNSLIQHLPNDYFARPHAEQLAFQVSYIPTGRGQLDRVLDRGAAQPRQGSAPPISPLPTTC